ncbi:hypothetical protein N7474_009994 [Penicillium riverlandense]|uniref:uncharacterized protein n=1 Tax=Penicillium riverlandense TaxID=1903569 RepID=UPI0025476080|nr:uncharacterized protein N7474_009994 [Penicillium riverlandense]KAJ5808725.1 hypothetical protein N7474_009994 [Penicillium riverlandense]
MDAKDAFTGPEQSLPVLSRAHPAETITAADPPLKDSTATPTLQAPARNAPSKVRKTRKNNNVSGKSTLFWVNSDPQSAAQGTKDETLKRIRSHVMSEHNRKKRLENTKRYKTKTWKHLAFQPPATAVTVGPQLPLASASLNNGRSSAEIEYSDAHHELIPAGATTYAASTAYPSSSSSGWDDNEYEEPASKSIWTYLGQGARDPFNTGHTQLTDRMMRHVQSFLWDLTQEAHPLQTRYKPKLQAHWAGLIQKDPAILHASICMVTSNAAMQRGEFPLTDPSKPRTPLVLDTLHHRGETIRLVNEGLSDPAKAASDELIAAVSTLLTIEIASGNPDYLKIHLAGLRQMIALRENFADVPSDIRFQISWTDIRVACMAHAKPIFPFIRGTRPEGLSLTPLNDDIAQLATRLISLTKVPGIFNDKMIQIIYDLLELSWYAEWIKGNTGHKDISEETEDYFNNEVPGERRQLDRGVHAPRLLALPQLRHLELLSFSLPLLPKPIIALRLALAEAIPAGVFDLCPDLLLWMLFIGAACSSYLPTERIFFVSELAAASRLQGINTWQEARPILLGFFYVDRVHLPMLRQIWEEVQRQHTPTEL